MRVLMVIRMVNHQPTHHLTQAMVVTWITTVEVIPAPVEAAAAIMSTRAVEILIPDLSLSLSITRKLIHRLLIQHRRRHPVLIHGHALIPQIPTRTRSTPSALSA